MATGSGGVSGVSGMGDLESNGGQSGASGTPPRDERDPEAAGGGRFGPLPLKSKLPGGRYQGATSIP